MQTRAPSMAIMMYGTGDDTYFGSKQTRAAGRYRGGPSLRQRSYSFKFVRATMCLNLPVRSATVLEVYRGRGCIHHDSSRSLFLRAACRFRVRVLPNIEYSRNCIISASSSGGPHQLSRAFDDQIAAWKQPIHHRDYSAPTNHLPPIHGTILV